MMNRDDFLHTAEAKTKQFKEQLQVAISSQDVNMLQHTISDFETAQLPDSADVQKAKQLLIYLRISQSMYHPLPLLLYRSSPPSYNYVNTKYRCSLQTDNTSK